MAPVNISRRRLFEIIHSSDSLNDTARGLTQCMDFISQHHDFDSCIVPEELLCKISDCIKAFLYRCRDKWRKNKRICALFLEKNNEWLDSNIFPVEIADSIQRVERNMPSTSQLSTAGRPAKDWDALAKRSKQRKAQELLSQREPPELIFAASQGTYKKNPDLKYVLNFAMISPSRPAKIRKLIKQTAKTPEWYTPDEALSLLVETGMTKQSYQTVRLSAKRKNADIYPPYNEVRKAKVKCYPGNITITEDSAEVPLQNLLDHTALRIIEEQREVMTNIVEGLEDDEQMVCKLVCKYGFDGSSGQSEYKQRFSSPEKTDESLFCATVVPLQLKCGDQILWENPVPSSTRFCRPLRLNFAKETTELSQGMDRSIKQEIDNLQPMDVALDITYEVEADMNRIADMKVKYELHLTMVDQKVINALTETKSSMRCYICNATPTQFNNLEEMPCPDPEAYVYGLSPLHKLIRCFEMLLHIAYRAEIKKWRVSSAAEKESVKRKKQEIHDRFKDELGLKVDEPKQGAGNTNDGNTARRAFKNVKVFADICGLDENLINRYQMIMVALSCKLPLEPNIFGTYCRETAKLQLQLYPWFRFPVSVHVLLVHGARILSSSVLPIGMMSEEAQEARNKDNKIYRRRHARKTSRTDNISDVFHRLMVTGDIVISSKSLRAQKSQPLTPDVQNMIKDPTIQDDPTDSAESDSE